MEEPRKSRASSLNSSSKQELHWQWEPNSLTHNPTTTTFGQGKGSISCLDLEDDDVLHFTIGAKGVAPDAVRAPLGCGCIGAAAAWWSPLLAVLNTSSTLATDLLATSTIVVAEVEGSRNQVLLGWPSVILIVVMAILSVVTIVGNLIVLLSYYLDKTIRQPSNYFIFSLAVSDLIIGLEGFPVYTYFFINDQRWPFGAFVCDLWLSIDYSCCLASIYTVLGITVDRYCSVKYPAAYRNWRTQSRILIIIAATWIIPSLLFVISIFGYGFFSGRGRILKADECYVQFMTNAYLNMGMYIAYYWSTLFLMLYLYYGIYSAAKKLANKSDQKNKRLALLETRTRASTKREAVSTMGVSEAALSNSAVESPHSSDSYCPRTNTRCASTSLNTTDANGKLLCKAPALSVEQDKSSLTVTGAADKSTTFEKDPPSAPFPSSSETIERDLTTGAFQVDDEFPFIDELNSNSSLFGVTTIADDSVGVIIQLGNEIDQPNYHSLAYQLSFPKAIPNCVKNGNSTINSNNVVPNFTSRSKSVEVTDVVVVQHSHKNSTITDRPELEEEQRQRRPRKSTSNANAIPTTNVEVVIQKVSNGHGPIGVRRLLTAMRSEIRSQSARVSKKAKSQRAERKKKRKLAKNTQSRSENRARKALRTITIILGSFTILWTPFYVLATIYGFCERCSSSPNFNLLYAISYYLCYMNSPLNPICYAMANQQFKRTFKRILRGDLRRT
uniref:G-protein coupled receptors family 1 profile domain-containing protein n=1 Tax=Ditylenchus dipsaci TaxID=166011 RepID=A0A915CQ48_9BILA